MACHPSTFSPRFTDDGLTFIIAAAWGTWFNLRIMSKAQVLQAAEALVRKVV